MGPSALKQELRATPKLPCKVIVPWPGLAAVSLRCVETCTLCKDCDARLRTMSTMTVPGLPPSHAVEKKLTPTCCAMGMVMTTEVKVSPAKPLVAQEKNAA